MAGFWTAGSWDGWILDGWILGWWCLRGRRVIRAAGLGHVVNLPDPAERSSGKMASPSVAERDGA